MRPAEQACLWLARTDLFEMVGEVNRKVAQDGQQHSPLADRLRRWVTACRLQADPTGFWGEVVLPRAADDWSRHNGWTDVCPFELRVSLLRDLVGWPGLRFDLPDACRTETVLALVQTARAEAVARPCLLCGGTGRVYVLRDGYTATDAPCGDCHGVRPVETVATDNLLIVADALEDAGCPTLVCGDCDGTGRYVSYNRDTDQGEDEVVMTGPCRCTVGRSLLAVLHPLLAHLRSPGPHYRDCWALAALAGPYKPRKES